MRQFRLRKRLLFLVIGISGLFLGVIVLLLWSEGALTSKTATWNVLENALITLMGEYADKPRTITGRVLQLCLLLFGTVVFGAIVGKVSSFFVTRALEQETMMKQYQDHIIICNWNDKAPAIIQQLLEANKNQPRDIVIISASVIPDRYELEDEARVNFIQADPTHHGTLEKLQAPQAKAVILLADEDTEGPDEKNALIALAIKHLEQIPNHQKDIHVIGELVNVGLHRHLKEAGVDEIVSAREYSSGIIAQSAVFRNMSMIYQQLLTYSDDSNEFYFLEPGQYPQHLQGKTFAELSKWVSDHTAAHPDNPFLLLGIKRGNGEILLNPKWRHFDQLKADDALIVMAFQHIDQIS